MFNMFSAEGNTKVAILVNEARVLAGIDGPVNPQDKAWYWLVNELHTLSNKPGYEEADDTAVREAAYTQFIR